MGSEQIISAPKGASFPDIPEERPGASWSVLSRCTSRLCRSRANTPLEAGSLLVSRGTGENKDARNARP